MNIGLFRGLEALVLWYVLGAMNSKSQQLSIYCVEKFTHDPLQSLHSGMSHTLQGAVCVQLWPLFSDMEGGPGSSEMCEETSHRQPRRIQENTPSLHTSQRGLSLTHFSSQWAPVTVLCVGANGGKQGGQTLHCLCTH